MPAGRMPPAIQRYNDQTAVEDYGIRDVWADNLDEEMHNLRKVVKNYKFVAMDTEFPGVVARPIGEFRSNSDYQYQLLRCNVDILRIIQVGLSFYNEHGELAPGISTFQFNFKFSITDDMFAQDSIDLLQNSGIQFKKHEQNGIHSEDFAALLITSGVVLMDDISWLSFHSGFDFGYLLKMLTNGKLPEEEQEFFDLLKLYFPRIYDVKYLMKSCKSLKGGLQEVADQLDLKRVGPQHQAGSDSMLTGRVFFRMRDLFFEDHIDNAKYCSHLYGLGASVYGREANNSGNGGGGGGAGGNGGGGGGGAGGDNSGGTSQSAAGGTGNPSSSSSQGTGTATAPQGAAPPGSGGLGGSATDSGPGAGGGGGGSGLANGDVSAAASAKDAALGNGSTHGGDDRPNGDAEKDASSSTSDKKS